ncbi:hypothetical protein C0075_26710, partial [Rhizobium sp. KAs_5_22]
ESITPYLNNIISNDSANIYANLISYEINLNPNLSNQQRINIVQNEILTASNRLKNQLQSDPNARIDKILNEEKIQFERYESLDVSEGDLQKKIVRNNT